MEMDRTPPVLDTADVLIVGAGPAGLMASLCLHTFGLSVLHVDNRPGPTAVGRADGIQPRTLEVLRNIGPWIPPRIPPSAEPSTVDGPNPTAGIFNNLVAQGVKVCEASFWVSACDFNPSGCTGASQPSTTLTISLPLSTNATTIIPTQDPTPDKPLARTSRSKTCPEFIDVRDRYMLLLHQGFIERAFLREILARAPHGSIIRPADFVRCSHNKPTSTVRRSADYPIEAVVRTADGTEKTVRTKYLLGCDGARSAVRSSLQGAIRLEGEATRLVWAVMDCWVTTNFPDIRKQSLIHSRHEGSMMVIPRERDLVRFYVQLPDEDSQSAKQTVTIEACQEQASKILHPYTLAFGDTEWFSIYQIGQRLANAYTLDGRIILGGDAAHTHSPKAGQGMNISMLDMFSLAWKINLIEKGIGKRDTLMATYEHERRGVAQELLAIDAEYSKLFSGRGATPDGFGVDPQLFMQLYQKKAYFTSGCGAVYRPNVLNADGDSDVFKGLPACRIDGPLRVGERLLPGNAVRVVDGNPVEMEQEVRMDGAFRIYVFLGASPAGARRLAHLDGRRCFLARFRTSDDRRRCSIFDSSSPSTGPNPFFTLLLVSARPRDEWDTSELPPLFAGPYAAQVYADEIPNRRAAIGAAQTCSLHSKYANNGFEEGEDGGGIIVVRPDGYVGAVVSLSEPGWTAVERYFDGFLIESAA